nr:uncharacterized protein DDB_G0271670-like isoform X1 [Aedes albopictus]
MDTCGTVYGSKDFTDDCVFNEQMEQHHYNTYSSTQHSNSRRTLYLALNKTGQPRKIQIPVNRTLGKLATYTKALTQTVAHDRVERLISRLFGANHVRHGLKQLCETGRALQDLTEKVMRPRAACGPAKAPQNVGPTGAGSTAASAAAGGNKDKDSKDNMRKKKKKRRKCREDEAPGEHCFRPQGGSLGTNSGRKRPPGQAKSQKCSPEDGDCVVSLSSSSSSSSSSSGSPNSANSVSISRSSSSSSSNRPSASQATVPNAGAQPPGAGPKKKVIKKVNSKNTPSNVNSNNNKKPKKGPGGSGGGPNANKKAKQQQQNSSSSSSGSSASSSSSSSSTVPSVLRGRAKTTPARRVPSLRSATSTTSSSTTTTPGRPPMTTPANLDDTSQSEDDLEAELEADDLVHSSAEFIEEEDLDEGSALKPTASPWYGMPEELGSDAAAMVAPCCPFPFAITTNTTSSGGRSSNASTNTNATTTANARSPSVSDSSRSSSNKRASSFSSSFISSSSVDERPRGRSLVQFSLLSLGSLLIASVASTARVTRLLYL